MKKVLLMGCGYSKNVEWFITGGEQSYKNIIRLDNNPDCNPDIIWDLNNHPLPFDNNTFDEIHAYDVLEHLGSQGDYMFFFNEFNEYWRILKKDGIFIGSVPKENNIWAFGDPSHRRVFSLQWLNFLSQDFYKKSTKKTKCSDFRNIWKKDFMIVGINRDSDYINYFALKKL